MQVFLGTFKIKNTPINIISTAGFKVKVGFRWKIKKLTPFKILELLN